MSIDNVSAEYPDETNRRVVRFFSICLGIVVFAYAVLSFRVFLETDTSTMRNIGPWLAGASAGP